MDTSTPHSLAPELETRNRHKLHDRISKWIKRKAEQEELSTEVCSSTQSPSRTPEPYV
ncbi:hypothetical protein CBOM_05185 [Ceraceosorus bombacis]|uniref:Uncharacterized protein n=1 Tax=Ceraceosorus bombacis TaxID=401625 RepID=A0A0P1BIA4_9BASI|nr:hypothetical protein CBOM_05185 [Ceraceosorus bombacis]